MEDILNLLIENLDLIVAGAIGLFLPNPKARKILGKLADGINKANNDNNK